MGNIGGRVVEASRRRRSAVSAPRASWLKLVALADNKVPGQVLTAVDAAATSSLLCKRLLKSRCRSSGAVVNIKPNISSSGVFVRDSRSTGLVWSPGHSLMQQSPPPPWPLVSRRRQKTPKHVCRFGAAFFFSCDQLGAPMLRHDVILQTPGSLRCPPAPVPGPHVWTGVQDAECL